MTSTDIAVRALALAEERSGAQIRTLTELADLERARVVFDTTWPMVEGGSNLPSNLFRALVHAGAYACGAYIGGQVVGATVAFIAREPGADGRPMVLLHSHMAAVLADYRNRSLGTAMKCHQRLWALQQGIEVISWTFDPLVRRNARLNMLKLGAEVRGYERDFYGRMDDDYDFTDESDRVFAWWVVGSDRADAAALGRLRPLTDDEVAARPEAVIVTIPEDIVALREADPDLGRAWRLRVREQMQAALARGYVVTNLTAAGDYVLEPKDAPTAPPATERTPA
ncbi:MAG: GNAT family N-acetyltransferase [Actinobacteria bacterium]|nr:GNAT family N-acetyltransferase [Actinomycetota bacterium]MCB9412206.1 GNAT family N-acetyltransferase [Actinomycetota bacterium]